MNFKEIWNLITMSATKVIVTIAIIVLTFLLLFIVSIFVGRFIKKHKERRRRAATLAKLIQSIFRYTTVLIVLMIILQLWGINVMPILAGAGIVGIAIGFGAQSLIRDLLTGISIVFENYYDIDDVIEIKGFKGKVVEIGLKSTKILNFKGELKIFSNGDITEVTNFSKNPSLGIIEVEISKKENIEHVINLLEEKLGAVREMFSQIIEGPNILGVIKLSPQGFTIRITVKTLPEEHYSVERGIYKYIKELFEENQIEIPADRVVISNE